MSKPNIKFIYSGEIRSQVHNLQKGPARLGDFYSPFMCPEYRQIFLESRSEQILVSPTPPPIVSSMDINSKTNISTLNRHKSSDNIPHYNQVSQEYQLNTPILNIEEINESQMQIVNQKQPIVELKKTNKNQSEQIVLKAPSYKFTPQRQGELVVRSKKQYQKTFSVEKPLNGETVLKSRKPTTNSNVGNQGQFKSSNAIFRVQTIKESDFHLEPKASSSKHHIDFDGQIVLKAPKYKYNPKPEGNQKKEYVRAENSEKYIYEGIQTHRENDFISCFGCTKTEAKVYKNQDNQ